MLSWIHFEYLLLLKNKKNIAKPDVILVSSLSLLSVIVFAALFGTLTPLTLEKYKIDPALATGPFITTVNDILGLYIYFLIGQAIL